MYDEQQENSTQYTNHKISRECGQVTSTHLFTCRGLLFNPPTPPFLSCLQLFLYIENSWLHCTLLAKLLALSIPRGTVCNFCSTLKIVGYIVHCWQNCWLQASPCWSCLKLLLYIENCSLHCTLLAKLLASRIPRGTVCNFWLYIENCWLQFACTCTTPTKSMYAA